MVKSKNKPPVHAHAWRPLRGAEYRAVIRIHYFGSKEQALRNLTGWSPFTQRSSAEYDRTLQLREDLRYLNLPDLSLFDVRLNKHHPNCVELWLKDVHYGDDDLQRELTDAGQELRLVREGFKYKEIAEILLFFVRANFADIAPNWNSIWHVWGTDQYLDSARSSDIRDPGPSTYTRSSSPSRLSDVSGEVQTPTPTLSRRVASTPAPSPVRPRKTSEAMLLPSARWTEQVKPTNDAADHPVLLPTNIAAAQSALEPLPDTHPESWPAVRPHLDEALRPLFDAVPQARPPATVSPFAMCRAIKTALSVQSERLRPVDNGQQSSSSSNVTEARVKELEALLDDERRARQEAEASCKSAESDLEVLREAHAQAEEKLADLRVEFKDPTLMPALYQAFLGVHGIARDLL